jgi:DNA-binding response OmpR family regulator
MVNTGPENSADKLVLIVDDDKDIRDLLSIILGKAGFKVVLAQDGADAQAKARALLPDLILLDLMLPKVSGFETVHELQAEETAGIPIIVMTGRQLDPSTFDMVKREANVRDFIEKPIKTDELIASLNKILKTRGG